MTETILVILAVWFVSLFLGPALWLAMALAGTAFVVASGIPADIIAQKITSPPTPFRCWPRRCSS